MDIEIQEKQTREKLESLMISKYKEGIKILQGQNKEDGVAILESLLKEDLINEKEFTQIRFGVYYSLGNYLALLKEVYDQSRFTTLNKALYYLNQCQLIREDWEILRKMGVICRTLGFFPKALNLFQKALQQATNKTQRLPLQYQICQLCFLVGDQELFNFYYQQLNNQNYRIEELNELKQLFSQSSVNHPLVDEKIKAQEMLKLNPIYCSKQPNIFEQQINQLTINFQTDNLFEFLSDILKELKDFIVVKKKKNIEDQDQLQLSNTQIILKNKITLTVKQAKKVTKKRITKEKKDETQDKTTVNKIVFQCLDDIIAFKPSYQPFIKSILENYYQNSDIASEIFVSNKRKDNLQQSQYLTEKYKNDNNEQYPIDLIAILEKKNSFYTIAHLCLFVLNSLIKNIYFSVDSRETYGPSHLRSVRIREVLSKMFFYYSQISNIDNFDPFTILSLLELVFEYFRSYKTKNLINTKKKHKVQRMISIINQLKFLCLYRIDRKKVIESSSNDENLIWHYLVRYYHIMAWIHSEKEFENEELASHSTNSLLQLLRIEKIYYLPWLSFEKVQTSNIQEIIENRSKLIQLHQEEQDMKSLLLENSNNMHNRNENLDTIVTRLEKILRIYLSGIDNENTVDQLKTEIVQFELHFLVNNLIQKFSSALLQNQTVQKNLITSFETIELVSLKIAIVKTIIQHEDQLSLYNLFYTSLSQRHPNKVKLLIVMVSILNLSENDYPLRQFFGKQQLNNCLELFKQALIESESLFQTTLSEFIDNFDQKKQLQLHLLDKIDFNDQYNQIYRLRDFVIELEDFQVIQQDEASQSLDSFENSSEIDEFYYKKTNQDLQLIVQRVSSNMNNYVQLNITAEDCIFQKSSKKVKLSEETFKVIQKNIVEINLGSHQVQEEIKNYVRQYLIQNGKTTFSELIQIAKILIEKVILKDNLQMNSALLEFLSLTLPNIYRNKITEEICLFCTKVLSPTLSNYQSENYDIFNRFLSQSVCEDDNEIISKILKLKGKESYYKDLFYTMFRVINYQNIEESTKYLVYAICESPNNLFYLQTLYQIYYDMSSDYFSSQVVVPLDNTNQRTNHDNFVRQKKVFIFIQSVVQLPAQTNFFNQISEKSYIMNLFKYFERKWRYYDKFSSSSENGNEKFTKCLQILSRLKENKVQNIQSIEEIHKESLRIRILNEVVINRRNITLKSQKLIQHIKNLIQLQQLCEQIQDKFDEILDDSEYGKYMEVEVLISLYRIIRRFLKFIKFTNNISWVHNYALNQLKEFLKFIQENESIFKFTFDRQNQNIFNLENLVLKPNSHSCQKLFSKIEKLYKNEIDDLSDHETTLRYVEALIQQVQIRLQNYYKQSVKRSKYHRINIQAQYTLAQIKYLLYSNKVESLQLISEICQPQTQEIVQLYKIYNKQPLEKDKIFEQFYNHDIILQFLKFKVLKLHIVLLSINELIEPQLNLLKRLLKLYQIPHREQIFINKSFGLAILMLHQNLFSYISQQLHVDEQLDLISQIIKVSYSHLRKNRSGFQFIEQNPQIESQQKDIMISYYQLISKQQEPQSLSSALGYLDHETKKKQKKISQHQDQ